MANAKKLEDEHKLAELGYKQELNRSWSVVHNFGVSFSIISVVTGITTFVLLCLYRIRHYNYTVHADGH